MPDTRIDQRIIAEIAALRDRVLRGEPISCRCACPDGACEHVWDGPEQRGDTYTTRTCSRCGLSAADHDIRCF